MKKRFFICVIFFFSVGVFAQDKAQSNILIDSLKLELKRADSNDVKVTILYALGTEYTSFKPNEALIIANQIKNISMKNASLLFGTGLYENLVAVNYLINGKIDNAIVHLTSAENILYNYKNKEFYIDTIYLKMMAYFYKSDFQNGNAYLDKGIKLCLEYKKPKVLIKFYSKKAQYFEVVMDDEQVLKYYLKADSISKNLDFNKSEISDFSANTVEIYCGISAVYTKTKQYDLAQIYARKSLIKARNPEFKNKLLLAKSLYISGCSSLFLDLDNEAYLYIRESMNLNKALNDRFGLGLNIDLLCNYYLKKKNYKKVIFYAQQLASDYKNYFFFPNAIEYLASAHFYLGNISEANKYKDELVVLIEKDKLFDNKKNANYKKHYEAISKISYASGNYKQAYFYLQKYNEAALYQMEKLSGFKIKRYQMDFENSQKDLSIKELKIAQQESKIKLEHNENKFNILTVIGLSLLIVTIALSYVVKTTKKLNHQLEINNAKLANTTAKLSQTLEEKDVLFQELHHRVKNNLQLVKSLLSIQSRETNNTETIDLLGKAQSRITAMSLVHEQLYQMEYHTSVDFETYLNNLSEPILNATLMASKKIYINIQAKEITFDIEKAIQLGLILSELIINSVKYSFNDTNQGAIFINVVKRENTYRLTYEDNGTFDLESYNSHNGKSIGLQLIQLLVLQLKGTLEKPQSDKLFYKITFSA